MSFNVPSLSTPTTSQHVMSVNVPNPCQTPRSCQHVAAQVMFNELSTPITSGQHIMSGTCGNTSEVFDTNTTVNEVMFQGAICWVPVLHPRVRLQHVMSDNALPLSKSLTVPVTINVMSGQCYLPVYSDHLVSTSCQSNHHPNHC